MGSLVIGRDGSCDIVLDDVSVSRWHLKLDDDEDGTYRLTDLGSTNGTYVFKDRQPVGVLEALVTLADRVKIGKYDFSVRELISQARGRQARVQDVASVKSTEALAGQGPRQQAKDGPRRWRLSSAFTFVIGFSVMFWMIVIYLMVGL